MDPKFPPGGGVNRQQQVSESFDSEPKLSEGSSVRSVQDTRPKVLTETKSSSIPKSTPVSERVAIAHKAASFVVPPSTPFRRFVSVVIKPPCLYLLNKGRSLFSHSAPFVRLADRAISYVGGLTPAQGSCLTHWVTRAPLEEQSGRLEAAHRIMDCVNHGSNSLSLSDLGLTDLPDTVGELSWLSSINLENNNLSALPDGIVKMKNLSELNCRHNCFKSLPVHIVHCSGLTSLDFSYNVVSNLPAGLGQLKNLETLALEHNQFRSIPDQLIELKPFGEYCRIQFFGNGVGHDVAVEWKRSHDVPNMDLLCISRITLGHARGMALSEKIENWFDIAGERMPDNLPASFTNERTINALNDYLVRLMKTETYNTRSGAQVTAKMMTHVLRGMENDPDVMARCTESAIDALQSCEDGTQLALNEMYISAQLTDIERNGNLQDLIELKRALIRQQTVEDIAEVKYLGIVENFHQQKNSRKQKVVRFD